MIEIKLLHDDAKAPTRANPTDAGLDLYADIGFPLLAFHSGTVTTGISIAIPDGYVGQIRPRSGLAVKHGIDVLAGTIDSSYRGEVKVVLINHGFSTFQVNRGDRIAQLLIQPVMLWNPVVVDELDDTERGAGGFGSSGL